MRYEIFFKDLFYRPVKRRVICHIILEVDYLILQKKYGEIHSLKMETLSRTLSEIDLFRLLG